MRDATFRETWEPGPQAPGAPTPAATSAHGESGVPRPAPTPKRVNHTLAIASLGGATNDNEWNYVQCKLMRALGVVFIENQARI